MTDAELKEIERRAGRDNGEAVGVADFWTLVAEVKRLREENRKLQVEVIDWESRVRSEREACAKLVESHLSNIGIPLRGKGIADVAAAIAAAIRARST